MIRILVNNAQVIILLNCQLGAYLIHMRFLLFCFYILHFYFIIVLKFSGAGDVKVTALPVVGCTIVRVVA